jgi:hypothetical protein
LSPWVVGKPRVTGVSVIYLVKQRSRTTTPESASPCLSLQSRSISAPSQSPQRDLHRGSGENEGGR